MIVKDSWRGLIAVSGCALLAGCGWFGSDGAPSGKARPGAETEQGVSPVDETRGSAPAIGSVVAGKGGQRAQKEAAEKESAARDAKERDARDSAEREAKAKQQSIPLRTTATEPPPADAPATPELAPAPPKS